MTTIVDPVPPSANSAATEPVASGPAVEIPHLTDAWHRSRKNYALFSGILLAWVLVGIELTDQPFENVNVRLQVPQAAPLVFIALVVYFGFRATIEWYQCDARRRALLPSRVDFVSGHVLAILAIGSYLVQRLLAIQLGTYLTSPVGLAVLVAVPFGMGVGSIVQTLRRTWRVSRYDWALAHYGIVLVLLLFSGVSVWLTFDAMTRIYTISGGVAGALVSRWTMGLVTRLGARSAHAGQSG